jgi:hypothetical protein
MQTRKIDDWLEFNFNPLESRLLQRSLRVVIANYKIKPQDLDPKTASVWYSARGCKTAGMSEEETQEWVENLHDYKSHNALQLGRWCDSLASAKSAARALRVKLDEAHILLTALNDHRLLLAAMNDIGQKEMDTRDFSEASGLSARQLAALAEMYFLGLLIEQILHFLPGNPSGWAEAL